MAEGIEQKLSKSILHNFLSGGFFAVRSGTPQHFGQSIWRKIQNLGLSSQYLTDIKFKKEVHLLLVLLLLLENEIYDSFREIVILIKENYTNEIVLLLLNYVDSTYIRV